jgi:hypothetical protein
MYMFVDPDKCGAGTADSVVFSRSNRRALFGEVRHIVAALSPQWRPDHIVDGEGERVNCTTNGSWLHLGRDGFDSTVTVVEHSDTGAIASVPATADEDARISLQPDSHERPTRIAECSVPSANTFAKLIATTEGRSEGKWVTMKSRSRRSLDEVSWLTGRINIPAQFTKFQALDLPTGLLSSAPGSSPNEICAPTPPEIQFFRKKNKLGVRENPAQAAAYEQALKNRPDIFQVQLWNASASSASDTVDTDRLRVGVNVSALGFQSIMQLPKHLERAQLHVQWRVV